MRRIKFIGRMGILISILLVTFASCSSEKVKAVIVDATITISPTDPTKVNFMVNEGRYKNLYVQSEEGASGVKQMPSSLWESFKSEELVTRIGGAISVADMNEGVKKMEYCISILSFKFVWFSYAILILKSLKLLFSLFSLLNLHFNRL